MSDTTEKFAFKPHPIQTNSISVRELYIKANEFPDVDKAIEVGEAAIRVGHSKYDEETKVIVVALKLEGGLEPEKTKAPFTIKVELVGEFQVDESKFPKDQIYNWADRNAPMILMPYLREHVYSLTMRCGFKPMLLPLMEVPVFYNIKDK
jgi:preprotein translocase subunit SecB